MRKVAAILIVLLAVFGIYWFLLRPEKKGGESPRLEPIALKTHSQAFNKSIDKVMGAYLETKNAFIEDDAAKAKAGAESFIILLDSIPLDELKKDTQMIFETVKANINDIRSNAQSLVKQTSIDEMRKDFSMVTEMMYPSFFKTINYEGPNLYLQNCPMAFGDDNGANWISNSDEIINPYLGKKHPKYKATMLHCGEVKDTIKARQ